MNITINYITLYETVERSLSVIAKRSSDEEGNPIFSDITLGTREQGIITDYLRQAIIDLSAELAAHITAATDTTITVTMPSNYNSALETFIQQSFNAYCVSYALFSWFTVTVPRIANKYMGDCERQLKAIKRLAYEKKAPAAAGVGYENITGSVTTTP